MENITIKINGSRSIRTAGSTILEAAALHRLKSRRFAT